MSIISIVANMPKSNIFLALLAPTIVIQDVYIYIYIYMGGGVFTLNVPFLNALRVDSRLAWVISP